MSASLKHASRAVAVQVPVVPDQHAADTSGDAMISPKPHVHAVCCHRFGISDTIHVQATAVDVSTAAHTYNTYLPSAVLN
jgi:hypothetical protein